MLGVIIGDIVGSRFEFNNYRKKDLKIEFNALIFERKMSIYNRGLKKHCLIE